jgi:hypothetical protein
MRAGTRTCLPIFISVGHLHILSPCTQCVGSSAQIIWQNITHRNYVHLYGFPKMCVCGCVCLCLCLSVGVSHIISFIGFDTTNMIFWFRKSDGWRVIGIGLGYDFNYCALIRSGAVFSWLQNTHLERRCVCFWKSITAMGLYCSFIDYRNAEWDKRCAFVYDYKNTKTTGTTTGCSSLTPVKPAIRKCNASLDYMRWKKGRYGDILNLSWFSSLFPKTWEN